MSPFRFLSLVLLGTAASLHISGLSFLYIGESVKAAPWDILSLLFLAGWLVYLSRNRIVLSRGFLTALLLLLAFCLWTGVEALRSPQPARGLTMFLIMLRNLSLFIVIGTMAGQLRSLQAINRRLFLLGTLIALISLPLYITCVRQIGDVSLPPWEWQPGIIYTLDQGGFFRLVGFAGDPNFYSIYCLLPLLLGFSNIKINRTARLAGVGVIGLTLLLANSRSFLAVFGTSLLLLAVLYPVLYLTNPKRYEHQRHYLGTMLAGAGLVLLVGLVWSLFQGHVFQQIMQRFYMIATAERFGMWDLLLSEGVDNIWLGRGLRGAELLLAGKYSHNSFLDLLVETGLIGLILWVVFVGYLTGRGLRKLDRCDVIPWVHAWCLLLPLMLGFSFLHNPFFWVLAAVLGSDCPEQSLSGETGVPCLNTGRSPPDSLLEQKNDLPKGVPSIQ